MEIVCYFLFYYYGRTGLGEAAFYALLGGVLMGWVAVIFGLFDLALIPSKKGIVMKKALIHGGINTTVLLGYSLIAYRGYREFPYVAAATLTLLLIKAVLLTLMIVANFIGASLILKYQVAVENE
jgi:uncharacterized membrane protein